MAQLQADGSQNTPRANRASGEANIATTTTIARKRSIAKHASTIKRPPLLLASQSANQVHCLAQRFRIGSENRVAI
jgi:hypothetical protein